MDPGRMAPGSSDGFPLHTDVVFRVHVGRFQGILYVGPFGGLTVFP